MIGAEDVAEDAAADSGSRAAAEHAGEHGGDALAGMITQRAVQRTGTVRRAGRLRHAADDERDCVLDGSARLFRIGAQLRGNLRDLRIVEVCQYGIDEAAHGGVLRYLILHATLRCGVVERK
jgi:hypothetical protein